MEHNQPYSNLIGRYVLLLRLGGELGIKSRRTRRRMISLLRSNLNSLLERFDLSYSIVDFRGRLLIAFSTDDFPRAIDKTITSQISGISSISRVFVSESSEEEILVNGVKEVKKYLLPQSTFAVRARREGVHAYSSMEIAAKLGSDILDSDILGLRVDLTNPDTEIFLDIRGNLAFIYSEINYGIDGIPSTSQGAALALLRPNINSILSAWLMKKRGVKIIPLFFKTEKSSEEKYVRYVESNFSPVLSFVDLKPLFDVFKAGKNLCFYCQYICETICRKYLSDEVVQAIISPTSFNFNDEFISLEALRTLESEVDITALRPMQFGFHGVEPSCENLPNTPCCEYQTKLAISLPKDLDLKKIREVLDIILAQ